MVSIRISSRVLTQVHNFFLSCNFASNMKQKQLEDPTFASRDAFKMQSPVVNRIVENETGIVT